ncbi:hypothetical protein ACN47E_008293 [Coniothyrium glycines]
MDAPWLHDVLRFALTATASTERPWDDKAESSWRASGGNDLVDPDDPGKDPRFRKLVEAILFSRKFLQTYNLVLLGTLLVFTAWHWGEKVVLSRRRRRLHQDYQHVTLAEEADTWSSSSSTLEGDATPPNAATKTNFDETSPLLARERVQKTRLGFWWPYYKLKSMLQYQPAPIPLINKVLPTNAVSLLIIAWVALNIFYNLYRMPLSLLYLFVFADRCGIIFISNLPLLYLLAAKNQPVKFLTGYSYESLNIFHRRVGELVCLEAFLHFMGMLAVWYGLLRHIGFTLSKFLFNRVVLLGLAALLAYEVIYFTSLGSFRQRWYEVFLATHIILQVAGLVFLWFHHHTSRPYVGISLAIFLVDRLLYRMWLKSSTHPATLTILEDNETILLSANWELGKRHPLRPKNMTHGWQPNEHIFISVPSLSRSHALQSHPFTIFSAAPTSPSSSSSSSSSNHPTNKHAWFSLLIRPQSPTGFTHTLLHHARSHTTTRIRLDGPYGSPHALSLLSSSSTAILVAAGSGIAVAYPLLHALLNPPPPPSLSLPAREPPPRCPRSPSVKFLCITHDPAHRSWLPEHTIQELRDWGCEVYMAPATRVAGRPDVPGILGSWVSSARGRAGVVVSGPEGLVRDVRNWGAGMVGEGRDVDVGVEKFGW